MNAREECTGYDLAMGAATGIRVWRVDALGRLTGWSFPKVWTPGENTAECGRRRRSEKCRSGECGRYHGMWGGGLDDDPCMEPNPCEGHSPDCGCGFWAYHDGVSQFGDGSGVVGVVEGYGKTTVGTKGFRSQKARIVALAFPHAPEPSSSRRAQRAARWNLSVAVVNVAAVVLHVWNAVGDGFDSPWRLFGLCNVAAAAWFFYLYWQARKRARCPVAAPAPKFWQPGEVEARIRRNYPDVEFYDSVEAMKAAHPIDPLLEPTPENDPDFWTRSVQSSEASGANVTLTASTAQFTDALRKAQRRLEHINLARGGRVGRWP